MAGLFGGQRGSDPTDAAQDVMYEAWEATGRSKRIALARKALKVSPLCADAYVLLAEEEAGSVEEVLDYYQKGLIVSAKMNDIDPQAWLADILARIAAHPAHRIDDLLPWNWRSAKLRTQPAAA
ncbi:transposase domain-containing protein [Mesorhizobium sp. M0220]|uniref:transposase domain-containing protein n=1 Tax=unclassified Mesorhizobium TaxID=325217 RepID=UPI0033373BA0